MSLTQELDSKYDRYDLVLADARQLFMAKLKDYGLSWTIMRTPSLTDQLYIKAMRIRSIQEAGTQMVADDVKDDFVGLINYSLMALIQLERASAAQEDDEQVITLAYDKVAAAVRALMVRKDHDYGEAWRQMRVSSITDMILMKLLRIQALESSSSGPIVSESVDAGYQDIVNYAAFAIILLDEKPS